MQLRAVSETWCRFPYVSKQLACACPVYVRPGRLHGICLTNARQDFKHMLKVGLIRPSGTIWSSPIHLVPKKEQGGLRPCGGYRELRAHTLPKRYPLPHILDIYVHLARRSPFRKTDIAKVQHHTRVELAHTKDCHHSFISPF